MSVPSLKFLIASLLKSNESDFNRHSKAKPPIKSLIGSLFLHILVVSLIFGTALFKRSKPNLINTMDADLVDIEFTRLDQDLNFKTKTAQKKSQKKVVKSVSKTKRIANLESDMAIKNIAKAASTRVVEKNQEPVGREDTELASESGESSELSSKVKMSYDQYLVSYINKYKTYPRIAERLKQQGVVLSKIVISKEGKLKNIIISKSSGFSSLDQGTISLIKSLAPFKPLPGQFKSEYKVSIPIEYILAGS